MNALCLVVLLLAQAQPPAPAVPARDARIATTGTGAISGVVLSEEAQPRPLRRARVTLSSAEMQVSHMAVTDDRGVFSFTGLPAGRFMLAVAKEAHPMTAYGAKRPGRPGMSIAVAEGQHVKEVAVRVPRGAVITGTVLDPTGQPAQGAMVRATRYAYVNGERRLVPGMPGVSGGAVDDRGTYRIYGLPAGEYVVVASFGMSPFSSIGLEATTPADVARARQAMTAPATTLSAPGAQAPRTADVTAPRRRTVAYSPVFYPGTPVATQAATVSVAAGEERSGIDIQLQLVPTAKIEGTVSTPDGTPPSAVLVTLIQTGGQSIAGMFESVRSVRSGPDGRFSLTGIAAGSYMLTARGGTRTLPPTPGELPSPGPLWAMVDLNVDGNDQSNVSLELQTGMTLSGRVQFHSATNAAAPDVSRMRVSLAAVGTDVNLGVTPASVDASGAFTIAGVTPGRYRITASVPPPARWSLISSTAGGRETLDTPIEIRPQQNLSDVVLTFSDAPSEITGRLQDASGNAATDYHIIVFPADRTHWVANSRRIQAVRPSQDGKYALRNLPAGEYLVVAIVDVEQGEWFDPSFLQRIAPSGMKLTIAEGEKKVQDLVISR